MAILRRRVKPGATQYPIQKTHVGWVAALTAHPLADPAHSALMPPLSQPLSLPMCLPVGHPSRYRLIEMPGEQP